MLKTKFDDLSEHELKVAALDFFRATTDKSDQRDDIQHTFHCLAPRLNFFKNLPEGATLLDLGAGDGSLSNFRKWPLSNRDDLRMLALSLDQGEFFHQYDEVELKNFETADEIFPGEKINAVICWHFIEHMSDPEPTIKFLSERLGKECRVYLEWPHPIFQEDADAGLAYRPRHQHLDHAL